MFMHVSSPHSSVSATQATHASILTHAFRGRPSTALGCGRLLTFPTRASSLGTNSTDTPANLSWHRTTQLQIVPAVQYKAPRAHITVTAAAQPAVAAAAAAAAAASAANMSVASLVLASLQPVLKVGLLCGTGAFCARLGLLNLDGRRVLSGLVFNLLVPCLFLDKLGSGVGFQQAIEWWPLTFNMFATHMLGGLLGLILVALVRPPKELRNHIILATMVGNVGNLPMVLVGSLGSDPALASLGGAALGIQYIILANLTAAFFQFPFAIMMLGGKQRQGAADEDGGGQGPGSGGKDLEAQDGKPVRQLYEPGSRKADAGVALSVIVTDPAGAAPKSAPGDSFAGRAIASKDSNSKPLLLHSSQSNGNSTPGTVYAQGRASTTPLSTNASTPDSYQQPEVIHSTLSDSHSNSNNSHVTLGSTPTYSSGAHRSVFSKPHGYSNLRPETDHTAGIAATVTADALSPAAMMQYAAQDDDEQDALLPKWQSSSPQPQPAGIALAAVSGRDVSVVAETVPQGIEVVTKTLHRWWQVAKPMILGIFSPPTTASMVALTIASIPPLQALFFSPQGALRLVGEVVRMFSDMAIPSLMLVLGANLSKGPGVSNLPAKLIIATAVSRLLVLPLVGTGLVMAMKSFGWLDIMQPIGVISMLVTHAVPTAIIVHSMATLYNSRQDDIAALLFWEYLACAVTLPPMLALFLRLVM